MKKENKIKTLMYCLDCKTMTNYICGKCLEMKHEITTSINGITGHLPRYCRVCNPEIVEEKCRVEFDTKMGRIKCNNKMPCREHNFIA